METLQMTHSPSGGGIKMAEELSITERLDRMEHTAALYLESFRQIGENFKTIGKNFEAAGERINQQTDTIDKLLLATTKLEAISEVHHFRIRKLEQPEEPTADIPRPKQQGAV
jgi:hypothetical protein